jgi:hypothetical protein
MVNKIYKNIQSFIFIHNQDILLECIHTNKFNNLPNLKYVFLGGGDVSKLKDISNIIICRDLVDNIEEYPKLTSYTGWYAIWKNKLYDSDYINLFEYDVDLHSDFNSILENNLNSNIKVIGYVPINIHEGNFIGYNELSGDLKKSILKNYNINAEDFIKQYSSNTIISITSNHTFEKKTFEHYMEWMECIKEDIKNGPKAGHQVERSIMLFYLTNNIDSGIIPETLFHYQLNSHQQ